MIASNRTIGGFALGAAALLLTACGANESGTPAASDTMPDGMGEAASEAQAAVAAGADAMADMAADATAAIESAIDGDHRSPGNADRNVYRHPVETLTLFGIEPGMTVVEVWPGGSTAWYTEVLAPVLGSEGRLIAGSYSPDSESAYAARTGKAYADKLAAHPDVYANVEAIDYGDPASADMAEPGSADAVLLFRLYHNAIRGGTNDDIMADAFAVLKPGGVLGVVQHRSPEDAPLEIDRRDGYVKESTVIADAEAAGFELAARSEINANPADDHEHEGGVWTLPPVMALCGDLEGEEKTACQAEWQPIGESDRMTLKFVKPAA